MAALAARKLFAAEFLERKGPQPKLEAFFDSRVTRIS
jgi:hypothetical protein